MAYLVIILIVAVIVGGSILLGARHVYHESGPGVRPSLAAARRSIRQSRMIASGDVCVCGGTLQPSSRVSGRYGTLLGCTGCRRSWSEDGRRVVVRRPVRRARPSTPDGGLPSA